MITSGGGTGRGFVNTSSQSAPANNDTQLNFLFRLQSRASKALRCEALQSFAEPLFALCVASLA